MKIRCGSHQQNRSIVRPGLSLMAAKVALTAEEFRENSQRSIDLFNTEKLSTNSTRVLKSVYCNSVHFCRCNLHGACGGKAVRRYCSRQLPGCNLHGACGGKARLCAISEMESGCNLHGACGGKGRTHNAGSPRLTLQSARGVWRQSHHVQRAYRAKHRCNLHGACGGKGTDIKDADYIESRSNLHGACGGKAKSYSLFFSFRSSNLHGACGGKGRMCTSAAARGTLQSARGVWRQRQDCGCHKMAYCRCNLHGTCRETERHHPSPEKNPRKFMQTYCIFIHLAV